MNESAFDPRDFRQALGAYLTGVTVVTAMDKDGNPRGFTANSFTSVSLDPPLVLVCLDRDAGNLDVFSGSDGYAVNILARDQEDVSNVFAARTADRFSHVQWRRGAAGHPVFEGTAAWFDCRKHEDIEAGDHVILIGRVTAYGHGSLPPLGFSRGGYVSAVSD